MANFLASRRLTQLGLLRARGGSCGRPGSSTSGSRIWSVCASHALKVVSLRLGGLLDGPGQVRGQGYGALLTLSHSRGHTQTWRGVIMCP
jgi:hypothetical protein